MSGVRYPFKIQRAEKTYRCYLDENGEICVLDKHGLPRVNGHAKSVCSVDDVKSAARKKLASPGLLLILD